MSGAAKLALAASLVVGALLLWLPPGAGRHDEPGAPTSLTPSPPPVSAPAPPDPATKTAPPADAAPRGVPAPFSFETRETAEERRERLRRMADDEVMQERMRQHELAAAADARWHEAVDESGYSARDLDPAVRTLFRNIELTPRYAEGGRIDGLVIDGMLADHPFARSGFREGDRIDSIQGVPLRDPSELPSLLARLGPNINVCVDRAGARVCRDLELE